MGAARGFARDRALRRSGEAVGTLTYRRRDDGVIDLVQALTFPEARGQGLAAVLVRRALEDLEGRDARVIPSCWYVRDFIRDNERFQPLLAS